MVKNGSYEKLICGQDKSSEIDNLTKLLKTDEKIPHPVCEILDFCISKGIGAIFSRNEHASNCRDARSKRYRLGHVCIPLFDEFKSSVGYYLNEKNEKQIVAMHCRGDRAIDYSIIESFLKRKHNLTDVVISRLDEDNLETMLNMAFGTVNPILIELHSKGSIVQFFDQGLLEAQALCPGTMMTNAGDHTWGIEFDAKELIENIENKEIFEFSVKDVELKEFELTRIKNPKSIGIITGNGPDSGMALWQGINQNFVKLLDKRFQGDISLPKVYVISIPEMGLSMELDKRENATWVALSKGVQQMKDLGVSVLSLACHTTHYYTARIREIFEDTNHKFISMPETVFEYLEGKNITDIAILGIHFVSDLGQFSAYEKLKNYKVEKLSSETIKKFHEIGYKVKTMSDLSTVFQSFTSLIRNEVKSDNLIIALTELSVLMQKQGNDKHRSQRNVIDALALYARKIYDCSIS